MLDAHFAYLMNLSFQACLKSTPTSTTHLTTCSLPAVVFAIGIAHFQKLIFYPPSISLLTVQQEKFVCISYSASVKLPNPHTKNSKPPSYRTVSWTVPLT